MSDKIKVIAPGEMLYPNTYVAVLDILGFKELVERNSTEELIKIYGKLKTTLMATTALYPKDKQKAEFPHLNIMDSLIISDTIIVWTPYSTIVQFHGILNQVSVFLKRAFFIGLPCRGCITIGDLYISNQSERLLYSRVEALVAGKAIVEAYQIEKMFNWAGCVISETAYETYRKKVEVQKKTDNSWWVKEIEKFIVKDYIVSTKKGFQTIKAVNWVRNPEKYDFTKEDFEQGFLQHKKTINTPDVKEKIENTWAFYQSL